MLIEGIAIQLHAYSRPSRSLTTPTMTSVPGPGHDPGIALILRKFLSAERVAKLRSGTTLQRIASKPGRRMSEIVLYSFRDAILILKSCGEHNANIICRAIELRLIFNYWCRRVSQTNAIIAMPKQTNATRHHLAKRKRNTMGINNA